jgi:hypothetical protein
MSWSLTGIVQVASVPSQSQLVLGSAAHIFFTQDKDPHGPVDITEHVCSESSAQAQQMDYLAKLGDGRSSVHCWTSFNSKS